MLLTGFSASAQIQQAWVARYNNGIGNGTNQAVKMALDASGNIYVTGYSQNANTNLGYVTIKYAPNGNQLWAARYDSTNYPSAIPVGLVLDNSNDVIVTGSALTVKYDTNGNQLWTAPYDGDGIAMDTGGNSLVTGWNSGFNTVKISPTGTELWSATYYRNQSQGPWLSQAVVVDADSNVYVAGVTTDGCFVDGGETWCYANFSAVKYDWDGNQLWTATIVLGTCFYVQVSGMALDAEGALYVAATPLNQVSYQTFKYAPDGTLVWAATPSDDTDSRVHALAVDHTQSVLMTGAIPSNFLPDYTPLFSYGTLKLDTNGATLWTTLYPMSAAATSVANAIAIDQGNNCYVTGYSPDTNAANDIVTIKYGPNGNQVWLQRYTSPGNSNAVGNTIAVDNNGNVYVTGYETTAAGGTEIVTIKYSPAPTVQRLTNGAFLLQEQAEPGESFDIQASADLLNWLDLGTVLADTNGLMQFDDTNAPNFPSRFYYTKPQ
jgi:hypothetical protein